MGCYLIYWSVCLFSRRKRGLSLFCLSWRIFIRVHIEMWCKIQVIIYQLLCDISGSAFLKIQKKINGCVKTSTMFSWLTEIWAKKHPKWFVFTTLILEIQYVFKKDGNIQENKIIKRGNTFLALIIFYFVALLSCFIIFKKVSGFDRHFIIQMKII